MKTFLITGATGYIGSMLIRKLHKEAQIAGEEYVIFALVRNSDKAGQILLPSVHIVEADLTDNVAMSLIQGQYDYIIHCASITNSAEMVTHPLDVTSSIINTTQNVMDLAKRSGVKSVVYLSSMEVYGVMNCADGHLCTEEEAGRGEVDLCNERSCYPLSKRMAENICFSYFKQYNLPVKVARLAQTFGEGVLSSDNRVFAQFARSVINNEDIILHTTGQSMGNYCEINDAIDGILTILYRGQNGEVYNVVNESCTMKIFEMAELVAKKIAKGRIGVKMKVAEDNSYGYARETGVRLSSKKLRMLGWQPQKDLVEMYVEVIKQFKSYQK